MGWLTPALAVSLAALACSCVTALVAWKSHRTDAKASYLNELKGEVDLLRDRVAVAEKRGTSQGAVIEGQRKEIAKLTVAEADCRRDNETLKGRVQQLEGELRQIRQVADSRARVVGTEDAA